MDDVTLHSAHLDAAFGVVGVCFWVEHEKPSLIWHGFDTLYNLLMRFERHVVAVHFDDSVRDAKTGRFCRSIGVYFAYKVTHSFLIG